MRAAATFLVCAAATLSCGGPREAAGPVDRYPLTGSVVRLDPQRKIATIRHDVIKDSKGKVWMEAMTMDFPVRESSEFAKLTAGSRIRAKVFQRPSDFDYWIGEVEAPSPDTPSVDRAQPPVESK
jgi:Cu/Ag efflux protein CusF